MLGSSFRHSASVGLLAAGMVVSLDLPVGVEELMREPVKAERTLDANKCHHGSLKTIAPKVSTTTTRSKRTTVAKSEKGFKLFRWLL
jgi:hypothetical protein